MTASQMLRRAALAGVLFLSSTTVQLTAQVPAARIDSIFSFARDTTPGCAVATMRDGAVLLARGYGVADLEHKVPITAETVFYLASVSKQFAAAAINLLVLDQKLSLDDDVRKYVPELPIYQRPITIRHLMHHTSGLRDYLELFGMAGLAEAGGFPTDVRETAYWVALLRYIGCTGHAHEVATVFGDEIAIRAQTLVHDAANPAEVMRDVITYATSWRPPEEREQIVQIQQTALEWAVHNFASGCEVADMLVQRLDFGAAVRDALRFTFERWNGSGYPAHASGESIPLPMRIVRATTRSPASDRAALVHDFGTTAVPNSIWDKPGSLTRAEFDRVELHPMLTEQMLRRSPALAALNPVASAHHEKSDGSGYHKRVRADAVDPGACVLAAVEIYVGMTTDPADREALSADDAAAELRRLASEGVTEPRASRAVLVAAGHGEPRSRTVSRPQLPGGLTRRQLDVLRLAARGLTTQQIADRLSISSKTADHHIQHIYTKIGVSTRAAAALWATQHAVVS